MSESKSIAGSPSNLPAQSGNTARRILWNTVSQIIGKAIIMVLGIIVVKMATNYLGKSGYGEYATAFEYLAFFGIVADLGLYTVGIREMSKDETKIPMIIGNVLTIRTVVAFLMIGAAIIGTFFIPQYQNTRIPIAVIIAGVATIFNLITSTISSVLQVHLKMEYSSFASVVGKIVNVGYMAFVIYILHATDKVEGLYQMVWAGAIGNAIMLVITYHYSSKLAKIRYRFDKEFFTDVIMKALPYGIALILNTIYFRIGSILLSLMKSTDDVSIYRVPMTMIETVGILPLYFMNSVLPFLTRSIARKDGKHGKMIQYCFDFLVMGSAPIVVGTVVLAYPLISLISSPEFLSNLPAGFYGSDIVLQILIFALAFSFINSLFGFILVADNRQVAILKRNLIGAIFTFILDFIFIPYFGVRAAAFSNVLTEFYVAVASYMIARHYLKFKIELKNALKATACAIIMGIVVSYSHNLLYPIFQNKSLIITVAIGGIVYFGLLFLTKTITNEMLNMVRKRKPIPELTQSETGESMDTPQ
ncbi:MAG: flippase [Candidatus Gracilibacteria bacterium]|jgi:O-antigen/teichoic acid export membrane protein